MPAPNGEQAAVQGPASALDQLGIALPAPPMPLGHYVETTAVGDLLFVSGVLPIVDGKLAMTGRVGETISIKDGRKAAHLASLNLLAAAAEHVGTLDRLKKLVKLTVLVSTSEDFVDHASIADGASNLFAQIFSKNTGHVRLVYGVKSLPKGAPVIVDAIFQMEPLPYSDGISVQPEYLQAVL